LSVRREMAARGGGGSGRGPFCAAARRRSLFVIALIAAFSHHLDAAGARLVPHDADDGTVWPWTYGDSGYHHQYLRRPAGLVAAAHGGKGRSSTETLRHRRPPDAVYSTRRHRTETDPYGRFIAGSSWKRRSTYTTTPHRDAACVYILVTVYTKLSVRSKSLNFACQ